MQLKNLKSGIFHSDPPNFVSHNAKFECQEGLFEGLEGAKMVSCMLAGSKPLSLFKRGLRNLISIASLMRHLNMLVSVARTCVLVGKSTCHSKLYQSPLYRHLKSQKAAIILFTTTLCCTTHCLQQINIRYDFDFRLKF